MRILFLCQRVPWPPDRGDRITTWHFLAHLLDSGHEVDVCCFTESDADLEGVAFLRTRCRSVTAPRIHRGMRKLTALRGLLTGEALTLPFFRHRELARAVAGAFRPTPPDLVYVYSSSMAQYVLDLPGAPRLMQFAELDSDKWAQVAATRSGIGAWVYRREARLLLEFERAVARAFDASVVVSDVEKQLFEQRIPQVTAHVLPNGVDTAHFAASDPAVREPHTVIFTGVMDYEPNVDAVTWFARECWPRVRARHPDARFLVVGSSPSAAVRALAGRDGIEVTGRVPQTTPWFARSAIAVAPLRLARGVQNKVLEAMSTGVPVVCSAQAAQGLGTVPGDTLLVRDGAEATAAAVIDLMDRPAAAIAIGTRAAAWVRSHFEWHRMHQRFDAICAQAAAHHRASHAVQRVSR